MRTSLCSTLRALRVLICSRQISQQRKKSNQKNAALDQFAPSGCPHHSTLPTGRLDSPSRLDRTKFDVHVEFSLPKPNASANFKGRISILVKQRSPDEAKRNPGMLPTTNNPDFTSLHPGYRVDLPGTVNRVLSSMDASQDDPLDRSLDATKWNPGLYNAARNSRITLRFIQATECEARAYRTHF